MTRESDARLIGPPLPCLRKPMSRSRRICEVSLVLPSEIPYLKIDQITLKVLPVAILYLAFKSTRVLTLQPSVIQT